MGLREQLHKGRTLPFIGVYDVFSASVAARYADGIFLSGYGFAASHYGLPDIGLISWSDMVQFATRVRAVLPDKHVLVDIDDGYGDDLVAAHMAQLLDGVGVDGLILEDQARPRRCGHLDGKILMDLDAYLDKLAAVRAAAANTIVIARTDAHDRDEITQRVAALSQVRPDAILVDGVADLATIAQITREIVAHCRTALADYKVPGRIEIVDQLPQLANGKPSRRLAAQLFR